MRILHCDSDDLDNPLRCGAPERTYQINSRLAKRHEIEVLTATYERCEATKLRGNVRYATRGFGIRGFGLSHHLTYLAALGPSLRQRPHDLVVEEFMPPCGFCLLPLWTPKPVVSIVQWFSFDEWQSRYKLPFEQMMRAIPGRIRYRHFIVQSRRMADYFRDLIPQASISVIPCGIDVTALHELTEPGDYALFLGRLARNHEGLDLLLQVWRSLAQEGIQIPLRIVGSGPDRAWVDSEIAAAGMTSFVHVVGRLEGDERLECLKNCRFLVMPSREDTFGSSALEAMAVSKPVVAFDIDHLNELVRPEWGYLVRPGDLEQFATSALYLWRNPARCVELGNRAYAAATAYTWDRLALRQESIYTSVARERLTS